jgi:Na+/proline symporter
MSNFGTLDLIVVLIYAAILVGIIYFSSKGIKSAEEFKTGGSRFGQLAITATQGASMKGAGALVAYPGGAWTNGIGVLFSSQCYNIGGWVALMIGLARKLKKCADKVHIKSLGDVFKHRYNGNKAARICGGVLSTWLSLANVTGSLAAIGLLLFLVTAKYGLTYVQCIVISGVIVIGCTIFGGLVSVVYTDVFQWFVMTPVIFIIIPLFCILNGATPTKIHEILPAEQFFSLKPNIMWFGFLLSGLFCSVGDIVYLTRYIASKDENTAVRGSTYAWVYVTLWAGTVLIMGLAAAMLITKDMVKGADEVVYTLMGIILPPGLLGLFASALFATTISTLDSYLHTAVVAITVDIRATLLGDKNFTDKQELFFARAATLVLGVLAIIGVVWFKDILTIINLGFGLYGAVVFFPLMATFFWKKSTAESTILGMVAGGAIYLGTYYVKWQLPIAWGLVASLVVCIVVALAQNKETELLPGFADNGKIVSGHSQDFWIFLGGFIGCLGTLVISVGIATWFNWIAFIGGFVILFVGVKLLHFATPEEHKEATVPAES